MRGGASLSSPLLPLVAFVAGLCVLGGAMHFSQPPLLDERASAIRQTLAGTARLQAQPGSAGTLAIGAVCRGVPDQAAAAYKDRILRLAQVSAVPPAGLTVTAGGERQGQLSPIEVRWKGSASHDGLVNLLAALSREQPTLFVDALDMKSRRGSVEFELRGRAWCWTRVNMP